MEKRVALFINESPIHLENCINDFLEQNHGKLHDIKFSSHNFDEYDTLCALLIYTPEEDER